MPPMSEEPLTRAVLAAAFADFERLVITPNFQRVFDHLARHDARFDEMDARFDDVCQRFDRLEAEYQALRAGLARVEQRVDRVEQRLDSMDERLDRLEIYYRDLLAAMHRLEERLSRLEKRVEEIAAGQEKHALRSEVQELRVRLDALQDDIRRLEQRIP
jgi:chromosome segregation ATPase